MADLGARGPAAARGPGTDRSVDRVGEPAGAVDVGCAGDEVLKRCAQRLAQAVRETDGVARVGGDEFVVICEGLGEADVGLLEARLGRVLYEPIDLGGGIEVAVGASIGTIQVDGTDDLARAIADADERMYDAKRRKGSSS